MVMIRFWVRTDRYNKPDTVMREYTDRAGRWRREHWFPGSTEWGVHMGLEHTGAGGSADWETVPPERAAEILYGWGYQGNPAEV